MNSIRDNLVRENHRISRRDRQDPSGQAHHHPVSTLSEDSTLFLLHRLKDKQSKPTGSRWARWFGFGSRD